MRAIRFLLLLVMLAVLPFQSWADARACAAGNATLASGAAPQEACNLVMQASRDDASAAEAADESHTHAAVPGDAPGPADAGDAQDPSQSGADLAESLLPASPLRFAAGLARSGAPAHRAGVLPDPDLPLQQRPPSA